MGIDYNTTLLRDIFAKKLFGENKTYESLDSEQQKEVNQAIKDKKKAVDPRISQGNK